MSNSSQPQPEQVRSQPWLLDLEPHEIESFPFSELMYFTYLGDLHWYKFLYCNGHGSEKTEEDQLHGLIQPHLRADRNWCGGGVSFTGHGRTAPNGGVGAEWEVLSLDPLHIEPSLLCRSPIYSVDGNGLKIPGSDAGECGDHGFIRNGKWVRA